jgi:hypothetical protein
MTTALEGGEGSASHSNPSLPPGTTRYRLYRRLCGPVGRSGQVRKISPPPGFDPLTVQPVDSRYINYATRPVLTVRIIQQNVVISLSVCCNTATIWDVGVGRRGYWTMYDVTIRSLRVTIVNMEEKIVLNILKSSVFFPYLSGMKTTFYITSWHLVLSYLFTHTGCST